MGCACTNFNWAHSVWMASCPQHVWCEHRYVTMKFQLKNLPEFFYLPSPSAFCLGPSTMTQMGNSHSHAVSKSSLTDLEAEPASKSGFSQALGFKPFILGAIPRTPHADSSCPLPSPDLHPKLPQTELHNQVSTVSHIGTSSAVGTIWKSSMLFHFVTPTPPTSRGLISVPQGLPKNISWAMVSIHVMVVVFAHQTWHLLSIRTLRATLIRQTQILIKWILNWYLRL